jgi:hypothetical protein
MIISGIQIHSGFSQTMFWPGFVKTDSSAGEEDLYEQRASPRMAMPRASTSTHGDSPDDFCRCRSPCGNAAQTAHVAVPLASPRRRVISQPWRRCRALPSTLCISTTRRRFRMSPPSTVSRPGTPVSLLGLEWEAFGISDPHHDDAPIFAPVFDLKIMDLVSSA